jgi:molybdate transport system permease protein
MSELWQPLSLSLRIALAATALTAAVAVPLAFVLARRRFAGRSILEALLTLPLVLPPTVVGYVLVMTFGSRGWAGGWLHRWTGYSLLFRFEGAVLAAAVVAFPLLYLPAKAAFGSVPREFEETARLLGANTAQVFWHVSLPMARRGIFSGIILAFARALGEFGATIMVFGWQQDRLTLPISIYLNYYDDELAHAAGAVVALTAISLAVIALYNRAGASWQE